MRQAGPSSPTTLRQHPVLAVKPEQSAAFSDPSGEHITLVSLLDYNDHTTARPGFEPPRRVETPRIASDPGRTCATSLRSSASGGATASGATEPCDERRNDARPCVAVAALACVAAGVRCRKGLAGAGLEAAAVWSHGHHLVWMEAAKSQMIF